MSRKVLFTIMTALVALPAPAAEKDEDKLQGEWVMVSREWDGKEVPPSPEKPARLVVQGDRWTVTLSNGKDAVWAVKLDPAKSPKAIDLLKGTGADKVTRGIYKLDRNTLTLCEPPRDGEAARPTEFKTDARGGRLTVWKRTKK